jgi:DNA-binding NtrC family response regulator
MARVLVIDDENDVRITVQQALEWHGHAVSLATNGREGIEMFRDAPYDLVVTDILMPEKEGIETIIELRKLQPAVKIVVISGGGRVNRHDFLDVAKKLGADAAVKKPFMIDEFCEVVNDCLAKAPAADRA